MRKWMGDESRGAFKTIASSQRVYRPGRQLDPTDNLAMHSVTVCDLATRDLQCEATVLLGPSGRVFYVSPTAVYVWVSDWARREQAESPAMVYRMPLDGSSPSALGVAGSPVDQFSFLESDDEYLNVLVRSDAGGDGMWRSEVSEGDLALLRVPVSSFGDGSRDAADARYRPLPRLEGHTFQNRFVGDHLLFGIGSGWGAPRKGASTLYVVPWRRGAVSELALSHGVDRIEVMGSDAVVIGTDGRDLHFSGVRLRRPEVVQHFALENASQGELRSHGFFYKPDGVGAGVIGLPVRGEGKPGYRHLIDGSASILFLHNADQRFSALGKLTGDERSDANDGCRASCVDWYGNARPLFVGGRVFALLGYELVEGDVRDGRMREVRRVSFAPRSIEAVAR
jgi:hypothetical protein